MRKETYFCDKCKKQVETKEDLCEIYAGWGHHYDSQRSREVTFELCVLCADKLGMVKRLLKKDKIINESQNITDRLFDLFADLHNEIHRGADHG